jgi:SAM-dependent methyltransferase
MLREPLLRGIEIDGPERIEVHRKILAAKPQMADVCRELYRTCAAMDADLLQGDGRRIELGAGVSFMKEFFPDILLTDVVPAAHLDEVIDAQNMVSVQDRSVRAFFGIHCFHHFSDPARFFAELDRTLVPGGGCVLIEPYFGPAARLVYPWLFASERFDMKQSVWTGGNGAAMSDANQALSYVVLFRDRDLFQQRFPRLSVVHARPLGNSIRYVISGGLNFRSLAPNWAMPPLRWLERCLSPCRHLFALHHVVVLRKSMETPSELEAM